MPTRNPNPDPTPNPTLTPTLTLALTHRQATDAFNSNRHLQAPILPQLPGEQQVSLLYRGLTAPKAEPVLFALHSHHAVFGFASLHLDTGRLHEMEWTNFYKPPVPPAAASLEYFGPYPYDLNWQFPVPASLETDRIKLVPFVPRAHAQAFLDGSIDHPSLWRLTGQLLVNMSSLLMFVESIRSCPSDILFAIMNKSTNGTNDQLAGYIGIKNSSISQLCAEIGPAVVLPAFHRTHVTTHAVGRLMQFCLDLPSLRPTPCLGLRRVCWTANPMNTASTRVAERMGMKLEGTMRWMWVNLKGKESTHGPRPGESDDAGPGIDCAMFAICWDEWEGGVREHVATLLSRP